MDTFFQKIRDIQKKERVDGPLSEVDDTFYDDTSKYMQELLKIVDKNPLSLEAYQLRDARRIIVEICERREVKILKTALANLHKSHDIFEGHKKDSSLFDELPYNMTYDEEQLYIDIINTILKHREKITQNKSSKEKQLQRPQQPKEQHTQTQNEEDEWIEITKEPEEKPVEDEWVEIKPEAQPQTQTESTEDKAVNTIDNIDIPDDVFSSPQLDESQIAMMFGEMPDNMPRDENNQPVRIKKSKTDISTPFTPPDVPVDDTVSLQIREDEKKNSKIETQNKQDNKPQIQIKPEVDETPGDVISQPIPTPQEGQDEVVEDSFDDKLYHEQHLVSFNCEVSSDILDVDNHTYGPFGVNDVALLPGNIVRILKLHDIIRIL